MKFRAFIIPLFVLGMILGLIAVSNAEAHGWRHGKNLTAAQIKHHPSWLKKPGHGCYHEDWGTTKGDIEAIPDEELGWIIIWKCVCVEDPDIADDWDCDWKIVKIIPDNSSNARILRIFNNLMGDKRYTKPRLVILAGGYVFRKHAVGDDCHWHNPKNKPAIVARRIYG